MINSEIINSLEEELLQHLNGIETLKSEAERLQNAINLLKTGSTTISSTSNLKVKMLNTYPEYPDDGTLFEKFHYFEDKEAKFWNKKDMEKMIIEAEGAEKGGITIKSTSSALHYYIARRQIICAKFNNSNKQCFYTTRENWVERDSNGETTKFRILPAHMPDNKSFGGMSEERKNPDNIRWYGII